MKNKNGYVLYDRSKDYVISFVRSKEVVIYATYEDALEDRGFDEEVLEISELPHDWKIKVLDQLEGGHNG